ncbi:DNA-directed DNA polymerase alpha subunit pol12 [Pseudogymnoascus australis]
MADPVVEELNALFAPASATKKIEADVLGELQSIMRLHSIPPQELFYKWESYSMKIGTDDMKLDIETSRALKKDIQDGLERESRNKSHVRSADKRGATPRNLSSTGDVFNMLDGLVPNTPRSAAGGGANGSKRKINQFQTPSISRVKQEPASSPPEFKTPYKPGEKEYGGPTVAFNDRPNAGQTVEILNEQLPASIPPIAPFPEPRIKLIANSDLKKLSYKPLAMKSSEASEILDDRIDELMPLIKTHHSLSDSAFGSAASQSVDEIVALGRIASDSADGKLNTASLVLETSRRMGNGLRVPLRLGAVPSFQFFPGQIVALRGINASGEEFTVSEVLEIPLLPVAASTPQGLETHIQRLRGGPDAMDEDSAAAPLNILIGAGPYTTDDNLDFEPLHALCSQAADTYADALILIGPFLDTEHPLLASGDFELPDADLDPDTITLRTIFKHLISFPLQSLAAANPSITILLIPSVRDAISAHVSWPQEPFPRKDLGLPKQAKVVGNPMTVSINELVTGISSQDILSELRHEEVTGGAPAAGGILARLPKYIIEQRHFFPLYPPVDRKLLLRSGTAEGVPPGAMLDVSYLKLGEMLNVRPDLLIVPSALPPFAKVVESVLVINPGVVARRKAVGTFARVSVGERGLEDGEREGG